MSAFRFPGPVLCIDHGTKVIGLALSQTGFIAKPLLVIHRKSKAQDFARINEIVKKEKIAALLLGLPPVPPDFVGTPQAEIVKNWAKHLAAAVPLPIYFWDEGMSSEDAASLLAESGKRMDRVDAHAAAVILQACLDAIHAGTGQPTLFRAPKQEQAEE